MLRKHARRHERNGFTLIELLVVISIIATLMSLILPAIQNAREAARRTQCMNNVRNLSLAALGFAASHNDTLPAAGYYVDHDNQPPTPGIPSWDVAGYSWVVQLLPYLDQQSIYDRWNRDAEYLANTNLDSISIAALVCPDDDSATGTAGGLTYVANGGFGDMDVRNIAPGSMHSFAAEPADWDGDGLTNVLSITDTPSVTSNTPDFEDRAIGRGTGVFWTDFDTFADRTRNMSARVGHIYDGSGNTIMFGENVNAGHLGWGHPSVPNSLFIFPYEQATPAGCTMPNNSNFANAPEYILRKDVMTFCERVPAYPNEAQFGPAPAPVNKTLGAPYLNSHHPGIVVVSFCDGSVRTLSESINKQIYTHLITPDGSRLRTVAGAGGFAAEAPLPSDAF